MAIFLPLPRLGGFLFGDGVVGSLCVGGVGDGWFPVEFGGLC